MIHFDKHIVEIGWNHQLIFDVFLWFHHEATLRCRSQGNYVEFEVGERIWEMHVENYMYPMKKGTHTEM